MPPQWIVHAHSGLNHGVLRRRGRPEQRASGQHDAREYLAKFDEAAERGRGAGAGAWRRTDVKWMSVSMNVIVLYCPSTSATTDNHGLRCPAAATHHPSGNVTWSVTSLMTV